MAVQFQKKAVLILLGYLGTLGAAGGGGWYCYEQYKQARDEEASVKKQIEMAEIKIKRVPALETDVICLRENVSELVKILPDSKEVNEFVNKINDFAAESNVRIDSLRDEKDKSKKKEVFDKVIYKATMTANLEQFLAFLSLCEGWERFVRVTSVEVKAGDWDDDMAREEVTHDIAVELETYSYGGNDDPAKSTTILNYEKRREALRDEIVSRRAEIRVERYNFVPNTLRRDPFVDPRRRLSDERDGGLPYPEQKSLVDGLLARAEELRSLTEAVVAPGTNFIRRLELETEIDQKSIRLQRDLDDITTARSISDSSLKRRIEREVMPIVKALMERDQNAAAAATLEDLRRFRRDMIALLDEADYSGVLKKHEIIKGRIDPAGLSPEAAGLLHEIGKAALQAEIALEFQTKDIEIGGAIVGEEGSVVIVNKHVLQEGDALEDGLTVHRIATDRIEFLYRGVVLARAR